jgi:hypothetical protein
MPTNKKKKEQDVCRHEFVPLGFHLIEKTDTHAEFAAAMGCKFCRLMYTKMLKFDRLR